MMILTGSERAYIQLENPSQFFFHYWKTLNNAFKGLKGYFNSDSLRTRHQSYLKVKL